MSINSSKRTGKDNLTKPAIQSQLARLKREEEEELWISGEELCTEGSSDEEDSKTCSRSFCRTNKNHDPRNSTATGRHHWIVSDNTKEISERSTSNSEGNTSSIEITNSLKMDTPNTRSNSSIDLEMNDVSMADDSCSDVIQDEEGQGLKDSEISWKVNRGTIRLLNTGANAATMEPDRPFEFITGSIIDRSTKETQQEDINELKELTPLGYQREFEFFTRLREGLQIEDNHENNSKTYLRNDFSKCELKNVSTMNEELEKQIWKVKSLDTAIKKFDNNVEKEMKETLLCQHKNREKLKEILENIPLETGKLAENTQQFFNLYNEYTDISDVHEKINQNNMHNIEISYNQPMLIKEEVNAIRNINEPLLETRKKGYKFNKKNKTLTTYQSKMFPNTTYKKQRMAILLGDMIDSNDDIVHSNNNPYCVNGEEKKLLHELSEKIFMLQTDKNCKKSGIQKDMQLSLNICNMHSISTSVSTNTTISTLQNVDEEIILELVEDSKIMMISSADGNK
ncbi:hypothetical protein V1478_008586 [Vespula squamosa]|uniref:Fibrous sheath-interacting protein 1 n=1 Tax=Vespula squamosa TaxID=30214 RepID=A0ABD2ATZ4_VESSQ